MVAPAGSESQSISQFRAEFCAWLATRAAVDFPDATRLRVRYFKYRSPTPQEVRAGDIPDGAFQQDKMINLPGVAR